MLVRSCGFAIILLLLSTPAHAQSPRIDPAGVSGGVLLTKGYVSASASERFVELAGGAKAKIVFISHNKENRAWPEIELVNAAARKQEARDPRRSNLAETKESLRDATGVWLLVESAEDCRRAIEKHALAGEFRALLKRGGVIAVGVDPTALGLDLMPGLVQHGKLAKANPELVGYKIDAGAAMLLKGRNLSAVGPGKITFYVPGTPPREVIAKGKTPQDLTALRRSAHDRVTGFPPMKVETPVVEKGTLVIVGGGGSPKGLYKRFVEYAGGPDKAKIVIFPTAAADPLPKRDSLADLFRKAGAKKVTILYGQTLAEVESKEFLDTLKEATGLWFDGGRQWRFVDCYENTRALPLMHDVLACGGVIGGTSAGATIQGDYLCRGGVFDNFDIRYQGYERGLGFLKGVAIDQHFSARKRQTEMTSLMKIYPQYLGIGLDEATAIVVKGQIAEVIGAGKVFFYDAQRKLEKGQPDYEALSIGGRYDLKERKVLAEK